jgi:hypothetical protein
MKPLNLRFRYTDKDGKEQTFERGDQYLIGFLYRGLSLATGHTHEKYIEGNIEDYLEIYD